MSQLAGETVASVNKLAVDYNAGTYACAEGKHDKVFHSARHAVCHLAYCGGVGVVGYGYGYAELLAEHVGQWYDTLMCPGDIRGVFNRTLVVIGVRRAYAHGFYLVYAAYLVDNNLQCFD